ALRVVAPRRPAAEIRANLARRIAAAAPHTGAPPRRARSAALHADERVQPRTNRPRDARSRVSGADGQGDAAEGDCGRDFCGAAGMGGGMGLMGRMGRMGPMGGSCILHPLSDAATFHELLFEMADLLVE